MASTANIDLMTLMDRFHSEEKCRSYLESWWAKPWLWLRWNCRAAKWGEFVCVMSPRASGPGIWWEQNDGLGAIERDGNIRLTVGKRRNRETLHGFIEEHAPDAENIYTDCVASGSLVHSDGWRGYRGLKKAGYRYRVTHTAGELASISDAPSRQIHLLTHLSNVHL